MISERLFRHTMPGILFLGSLFVFFLLNSGDPKYVWDMLEKEQYSFLIAILITSPILGLLISTIGIGVLSIFKGYSIYLNNPPNNIKWIVLRDDDELKRKNEKFTSKELRDYFSKEQIYIRNNIKSETLRYLERRWNYFWIHLNNITAIFLSLVFFSFLDYHGEKNTVKEGMLISIVIGIAIYVIFAIVRIWFLRKELIQAEEEAILKKYYS